MCKIPAIFFQTSSKNGKVGKKSNGMLMYLSVTSPEFLSKENVLQQKIWYY
jgi:hypothetical protein